ncbi:hypothetical protein ALP39_200236 [Pseudomonas marginalis pv. marginalis]|nr:hypothetical protein ALP39_200236 [Pseudomonas marginalis pv. marginalis]
MAVEVVDAFEVVDVDQQQGAGLGCADLGQQARGAQVEGAAVVEGSQWVAGGEAGDMLFAAVAFGAGHGQGNQHDCHGAFDQGDLDDFALEGGEVDQGAGDHHRQRLGHVKDPVEQQHETQLHRADAQGPAMGPQQETGAQGGQGYQQRLHRQHGLGPGLVGRQGEHGEPDHGHQDPGTRHPHLGKPRYAEQKQEVGGHQQAVGEPDTND